MGWTGVYNYPQKASGKPDAKAYLDKLFSWENKEAIYDVVKSSMVGSVYYAAIEKIPKKDAESEVFAVVALTSYDHRDNCFLYKEMDETSGPVESKCPVSILKLLTPTDSQWANEWRERCYIYAETKKAERKNEYSLNKLPYGSHISFELQTSLSGGGYNIGDTIELYKVQRGGKEMWTDGEYRFLKTVLPKEYDVLSIGNEKLEEPIHVSFNSKQKGAEK